MTDFSTKLTTFVSNRKPKSFSDKDIELLAAQCDASLPETYLQFMRVAGNGVDDFLQGSDFTLEDLDGVREAADELLIEAGLPSLPADAFVFSMHQGYQFYFFHEGKVFYFIEGAKQVEIRYSSFEEFFDAEVEDIEKGIGF